MSEWKQTQAGSMLKVSQWVDGAAITNARRLANGVEIQSHLLLQINKGMFPWQAWGTVHTQNSGV